MVKSLLKLIFIIYCLHYHFGSAQDFGDPDSIHQVILNAHDDLTKAKAYNQLSVISLREDYNLKQSRIFADSAFRLAEKSHYEEGMASSHFSLALLDRLEGNYSSALDHLDKNIAFFEKGNNPLSLPAALFQVAVIHHLLGDYDKSLTIHYRILKIYEDAGEKYAVASVHNSIGSIYGDQKQNELALEHYNKALKLFNDLNEKRDQAITLNNIGAIYNATESYDSAKITLLKALAICEEIRFDNGKAETLEKLAFLFSEHSEYEKALQYYFQSLKISKRLNDMRLIAVNLSNIGREYLKMKLPEKGIPYLHDALSQAKNIGAKAIAMDVNKSLSEAYADIKDFKNSLLYRKAFEVIRDSVLSEESTRQINQLKVQYDTEKKEKEIELLAKEREIQTAQLEKEKRTKWLLFGSAILLLLMIMFITLYFKQKLKNRELLIQKDAEINRRKLEELEKNQKLYALDAMIAGQEVERRRIAQDLHDGLGVLLSNVQMQFSSIQEEIDKMHRFDVYKKANELLDEACSEVRKIAHNMMPGTLLKLGLVPAIKDMCDRINATSNIHIELHAFGLNERLGEIVEITAYRLVQEALNNVVKHAVATEALVQLSKNDGQLSITIEDNGKGFNVAEEKKKDGMGLKNMESRVKYLNGVLTIDSKQNEGTTINIDIPVSHTKEIIHD